MRIKRHPRELLKEAADMVRLEAGHLFTAGEIEAGDGFMRVAREIERIRLTKDVK